MESKKEIHNERDDINDDLLKIIKNSYKEDASVVIYSNAYLIQCDPIVFILESKEIEVKKTVPLNCIRQILSANITKLKIYGILQVNYPTVQSIQNYCFQADCGNNFILIAFINNNQIKGLDNKNLYNNMFVYFISDAELIVCLLKELCSNNIANPLI